MPCQCLKLCNRDFGRGHFLELFSFQDIDIIQGSGLKDPNVFYFLLIE